jgi:hypothetical protein
MAITVAGLDAALGILDATVYLGVHNGAPGATGSTNELAGTRPAITFGSPGTDGTGRQRQGPTGSPIVFTNPGAGTYQAWSVWTAASGGTCRWIIPFDENRTLLAGDDLRVPVNAITCKIDV